MYLKSGVQIKRNTRITWNIRKSQGQFHANLIHTMQPCGDQGNGVVKVSLQSNRLKYHDENITVFLEHCEKTFSPCR